MDRREPLITKPEYLAAAIAELTALGFKADPPIYDPKQRAAVTLGATYYYWTKDAEEPYVEDLDARSRLGPPTGLAVTEGDVHSVSCNAGLIRIGPRKWAGFDDDQVGDPQHGKIISIREFGTTPVKGSFDDCEPAG